MQRNAIRTLIGSSLLALTLLTTGAGAQEPAGGAGGTGAQGTATTDNNDEGGMDLGWLGLLGLAGLLGLRRKDDHHVTRVDTTTGAGSARARV